MIDLLMAEPAWAVVCWWFLASLIFGLGRVAVIDCWQSGREYEDRLRSRHYEFQKNSAWHNEPWIPSENRQTAYLVWFFLWPIMSAFWLFIGALRVVMLIVLLPMRLMKGDE